MAGTGAVVGTVSGIVAINNAPASGACPDNKCFGHTLDDLHTSRDAGNVATVAWIVAGVGAGMAVTGWLIGGSSAKSGGSGPKVEPYVGVGAAGVHGSF
jgi:hypothetical protein